MHKDLCWNSNWCIYNASLCSLSSQQEFYHYFHWMIWTFTFCRHSKFPVNISDIFAIIKEMTWIQWMKWGQGKEGRTPSPPQRQKCKTDGFKRTKQCKSVPKALFGVPRWDTTGWVPQIPLTLWSQAAPQLRFSRIGKNINIHPVYRYRGNKDSWIPWIHTGN